MASASAMRYVQLGNTETKISAIGLGAMPLSLSNRPSEAQAIQVIHRALDLGVTLIDTADAYCLDESDKHHNERLIAKALKTYPKGDTSHIVVATKGGLMRPNGEWTRNGDPDHIRRTIKESFDALGGFMPIPLWQYHAPDEKFSIEQSLQPVKEAVEMGLIKHVGVSNFSVAQLEQAMRVVPIVSVQNQYNPWMRKPEHDGVLDFCQKHSLTFFPWSPVGGGQKHKKLLQVKPLTELAEQKRCSVYSLVLAWLRLKSACVVPIPGASKVSSIEDSVSSLNVELNAQDMKLIDQISDSLQQ